MQQVKVQLVFMLAVSQVTLTINTSILFSSYLIRIAIAKLVNLAIRDLVLRNSASKIF